MYRFVEDGVSKSLLHDSGRSLALLKRSWECFLSISFSLVTRGFRDFGGVLQCGVEIGFSSLILCIVSVTNNESYVDATSFVCWLKVASMCKS